LNLALAAAGVAVNILWAWLAGRECRRHGRPMFAAAVHAFALFQAIVWAVSDPYSAATEAPTALIPVATARTALELGAAAWTVAIAPASLLIAVGARIVRRSAAASR